MSTRLIRFLDHTRSTVLAGWGFVTMVFVLLHALLLPDVFPQQCTAPFAAWHAVLTIGFWLVSVLASLAAVTATYLYCQLARRSHTIAVWLLSLAAVPLFLLLPSEHSLLSATVDCSAGRFFQYLSWYMMTLIALCGMLCIRLLIHENKLQRTKLDTQAKEFTTATDQLQQLDKQKSEFVAIASHQLRSPLTAVRGYTSMLLEDNFGSLPAEAKEPIKRIEAATQHMTMTVEDYLNVSKIETDSLTYDYSQFDFVDEVRETCDDMRPRIHDDGIVLLYRSRITSTGLVTADRNKVIQILHNLIENAHQYTQKGTITVFVSDQPEQGRIQVDVRDTGIGMSSETLAAVFDKFTRSHAAAAINTDGSGLGLFVSQKMAEEMGGTITVTSAGEGKGSCCSFSLPTT